IAHRRNPAPRGLYSATNCVLAPLEGHATLPVTIAFVRCEPPMSKNRFAAIILAAGEGTRMRSARPKVLHELAGRPMIWHLVEALRPLQPAATVVVLGRGMEAVAKSVAPVKAVIQDPPRGTGDAVRAALEALPLDSIRDVLVLYGDTPLLRTETLGELLAARRRIPEATVAAAGMRPDDPGPYGRLVLSAGGMLERIVEARDADA